MTCAITAAIVHCTGLCRETRIQLDKPHRKYKVDSVVTYLFLPIETADMHTGATAKTTRNTIIYTITFVNRPRAAC